MGDPGILCHCINEMKVVACVVNRWGKRGNDSNDDFADLDEFDSRQLSGGDYVQRTSHDICVADVD